MSKKTYILISAVLIIILLVLIGFFFLNKNPDGTPNVPNVFRNFFPFGGDTVIDETPREVLPDEEPVVDNDDFTQKLRKITAEPVAGAGILDVKAGSIVRYIEKATGHIYEVELFSPRQGRISNTTIPMAYEAFWGNKNDSLVAQYLKDNDSVIDTYYLNIKEISTSTENTITGIELPVNISNVSVFGSNVFYLEQKNDSSYGYVTNFNNTAKKQIWFSPIKDVLPQFVNDKTVALTTKPHENHLGYLYFVDTGNGSIKKILGGVLGLSTLTNPTATDVLYIDHENGVRMKVYNIKNKNSEEISPVTFPEKCAWGKKDLNVIYCAVSKEYIDRDNLTSWYRGSLTTRDDIWKYDLKNKTSEIVVSLYKEGGEEIDAIKPILSENDQYLLFINKKDNSLWSLDLTK